MSPCKQFKCNINTVDLFGLKNIGEIKVGYDGYHWCNQSINDIGTLENVIFVMKKERYIKINTFKKSIIENTSLLRDAFTKAFF